ncbi:MAG: exosortase C-terminal domain/associated protein EpsI, partial [Pseudomonadota bacterium]
QTLPERGAQAPQRDSFVVFPRSFGEWRQAGPRHILGREVAATLGADDYHQITLQNRSTGDTVGFFSAWYDDQSQGGVHSPEICLPSAGWEIAWLERVDISEKLGGETPFMINEAIIQKGETRMMVFYWFDQKGRKVAWDFAAKFYLMVDGIATGRTDGALVRLTTLIAENETEADAEARLLDMLKSVEPNLARFIPQ